MKRGSDIIMETIKDIISRILGEWEPVLIDRSVVTQEPVVINGVVQYIEKTEDKSFYLPDITYILAGIVFIVCLYSVFRIIGGLTKWKI